MGAFGGPDIITDGLIFALDAGSGRSYSGSGTTAYNIINNASCTLNNGVGFGSGNGGYFDFDGVDDNITIPNDSIPSSATTNKVSICFWSYGEVENQSNSIIEARNSSNDRTVNIHMPWSNNVIYWDNPDRLTYQLSTGQSLGWHYWSFTKDAATGASAIYQDGVLLASNSTSSSSITVTATAKIGSYAINTTFWKGNLSVFQIYNKPLTLTEIQQNFNAQKNRFI